MAARVVSLTRQCIRPWPRMKLFAPERRLFEKRTGDWVVQVFEKGQRRELRFGNHIVQGAVSLSAPDLPLLDYTRAMLAGLLFAPRPEYALHLGLGTGSVPRFLHRYVPSVRQRIVEINPDVIDAAYRCFGFPVSPRLRVSEGDARDYVRGAGEGYDLVFVDCFLPDGVAEGLDGPSFFQALRVRTTGHGWVVYNSWGSNEEKLRRVRRGMADAFPTLYALSVRAHSNVIFIGGKGDAPPPPALLANRAAALSRSIPFDFNTWARKLKPIGLANRAGREIARA